jgi:hypothetical protein
LLLFFANLLVVTKGWAEKIIAMGLFLHMYACAFALFIQAKNKCPLILQHVQPQQNRLLPTPNRVNFITEKTVSD